MTHKAFVVTGFRFRRRGLALSASALWWCTLAFQVHGSNVREFVAFCPAGVSHALSRCTSISALIEPEDNRHPDTQHAIGDENHRQGEVQGLLQSIFPPRPRKQARHVGGRSACFSAQRNFVGEQATAATSADTRGRQTGTPLRFRGGPTSVGLCPQRNGSRFERSTEWDMVASRHEAFHELYLSLRRNFPRDFLRGLLACDAGPFGSLSLIRQVTARRRPAKNSDPLSPGRWVSFRPCHLSIVGRRFSGGPPDLKRPPIHELAGGVKPRTGDDQGCAPHRFPIWPDTPRCGTAAWTELSNCERSPVPSHDSVGIPSASRRLWDANSMW